MDHERLGGSKEQDNEEGKFTYLRSTPSRNDISILDGTFNNHNCIMQTALHFRNELLRASPQHKRTRLRRGASLEKVESLATNLAFFEALAGAKVLGLNI